jgi:hypothetical protein
MRSPLISPGLDAVKMLFFEISALRYYFLRGAGWTNLKKSTKQP